MTVRTSDEALDRARRISPNCEKFVVRVYDGFDGEWTDVSEKVSAEKAKRIWDEKTANGKRATSYDDIDYYAIYPADTTMAWSEDGLGAQNR